MMLVFLREFGEEIDAGGRAFFLFMFLMIGVLVCFMVVTLVWGLWVDVGMGPWSLALVAGVIMGFRALYRYVWGRP